MITWQDELYHHGIKGMHWGIRRYQNPDGTLTTKGRERYQAIKSRKNDFYSGNVGTAQKEEAWVTARREKKGRPVYTEQEAKGKSLINRLDKTRYDLYEAYYKNPQQGIELGAKKTLSDTSKMVRKAYTKTSEFKVRAARDFISGFLFGVPGIALSTTLDTLTPVKAEQRYAFYKEFGGKRYDEYAAKVSSYEKTANKIKKQVKEVKKGA